MEGLTKEQYAEILSTFERATWYLKCASEKLERFLPAPPAPVPPPELCIDCHGPCSRGEMYCAKCVPAHTEA